MSDRAADEPDGTRSANEAIAEAADKFASASTRNIPGLPDIPHPEDTANLRLGPDLNPAMLALLPLVGVWRGEGEGRDPESTEEYRFGQQIVVSHDGGSYLAWESRSWRLDSDGNYAHPDLREVGFWRISGGEGEKGSDNEEVIELLLTHSTGVVELFYGHALNQSSWELATDAPPRALSSVARSVCTASSKAPIWPTSKNVSAQTESSHPGCRLAFLATSAEADDR